MIFSTGMIKDWILRDIDFGILVSSTLNAGLQGLILQIKAVIK